eukprot:superscaffoldBa00000745_g6946
MQAVSRPVFSVACPMRGEGCLTLRRGSAAPCALRAHTDQQHCLLYLKRHSRAHKRRSGHLLGHTGEPTASTFQCERVSKSMAHVTFLCDITNHLNQLNLQLQGGDANVGLLFEKVDAFRVNLDLFLADIGGKILYLPTPHDTPTNKTVLSPMIVLLKSLEDNFSTRFNNVKILGQVLLFVHNPFAVAVTVTGSCPADAKSVLSAIDEDTFQLEMVQLQTNNVPKAKFRKERLCLSGSEL